MSTMIRDPSAPRGTSGQSSGILSGVMIGAAVGGVAGAVVGGIIGGIGGRQRDKARQYAKIAGKYATLAKERQAAIQLRDMRRDFRNRRAMAMLGIASEEGGTRSSAPQGAVNSLGAQFGFNDAYFKGQVYLQRQFQKFANKSQRNAARSENTFSFLSSASQLGGMAYGAWSTRAPSGGWGSTSSGSTGIPSPTVNVGYPYMGQSSPLYTPQPYPGEGLGPR